MKPLLFAAAVLCSISIVAQDTYLQAGKLIDTKNGTVLTNKTIVVSGNTIKSIEDGFVNGQNEDDVTSKSSN